MSMIFLYLDSVSDFFCFLFGLAATCDVIFLLLPETGSTRQSPLNLRGDFFFLLKDSLFFLFLIRLGAFRVILKSPLIELYIQSVFLLLRFFLPCGRPAQVFYATCFFIAFTQVLRYLWALFKMWPQASCCYDELSGFRVPGAAERTLGLFIPWINDY